MPGVLGTAASGVRVLGIFLVGLAVAMFVMPSVLGVVTGAVGVLLGSEQVAVVSLIAALVVMGWLA